MSAATAAITTAGRQRACRQWSYAHVLPYFRRQESWEGGASTYRGGDGPIATQLRAIEDPLVEAYRRRRRARRPSRAPRTTTARSRKASAALQMTIRKGRRCSAATAYLRPALARENLDGRDRRAGLANPSRRRPRRRRRISRRKASPDRARRARGDPRRRRHQFAAASDAVGHRRSRRARRTASR